MLLAGVAALAQPSETKILELENKEIPFFNGIAVSADLVGPVMLLVGDYGQYEAELRVNLKNKYFPVVELGYGKADADDAATRLSYKTKAPYGRVGLDFNLLKNKRDVNRLYGGLRYAYTSYKFDLFCPGVTDPTWGESAEFKALAQGATEQSAVGWSARYKRRLFHDDGNVGNTWYVPGYGKQGNARLGGSFHVIFEL